MRSMSALLMQAPNDAHRALCESEEAAAHTARVSAVGMPGAAGGAASSVWPGSLTYLQSDLRARLARQSLLRTRDPVARRRPDGVGLFFARLPNCGIGSVTLTVWRKNEANGRVRPV